MNADEFAKRVKDVLPDLQRAARLHSALPVVRPPYAELR